MNYESDHNISAVSEDVTPELIQQRIREFYAQFGPPGSTDGSQVGVSQAFIDSLDRVDRKHIKEDDQCVICRLDFLDDEYPLVVSLPCPGKHQFDLLCVSKWLETRGTCPMCRYDFVKNANKRKVDLPVEDDEEPYDDMYG